MTKSTALATATMEAAFEARDRAFDGRFVVAVTTTRIYCRPSCPARRPRPENTRFLPDIATAEAAGFRPCKRCKPDEAARDAAAVELALDILRAAEERVSLEQLAQECGYSPSHMQRIFTRALGLSPAVYARALREERAREALTATQSVTAAIYAAGFEASSRFYADMEGKLGMAPSAWANGGEGVRISWAVVNTSLGDMLVAASERGVCRLSFCETENDLRTRFSKAELVEGGAQFAQLLAQVVEAVEQPWTQSDLPIDVVGTAFQHKVWAELRRIPAGQTLSYSELAARLGNPKASRAVGGANGANPVAVLVPCHRVIAADGALGGYAYGEAIKSELLRREREREGSG